MKKTKTPLPGELKRRKRLSVELKRRRRASFWFLSPSIAGVTLFFLAPFTVVLYYAFTSKSVSGEFVGLSNFKALFAENQPASFRVPKWEYREERAERVLMVWGGVINLLTLLFLVFLVLFIVDFIRFDPLDLREKIRRRKRRKVGKR